MLNNLLNIRLTTLFVVSSVVFYILLSYIKPLDMSDGQIAIFSVTGILFGFYFGPILDSQKGRVMQLSQAVREQVMSILDVLAHSHLLPEAQRHALKVRLRAYVDSVIDNPNVKADNQYYDELLQFAQSIKDDDVRSKVYDGVSETQDQRDGMQSTYQAKLYSHEILVMVVLFSITLYFIVQTNYNGAILFRIMLAVLCAGLILLLSILAKYATLTHKKAKIMWEPMHTLKETHFEDITQEEVQALHLK